MKTLILTIAVLLTTSFAGFAQSNEMNQTSLSKQPFIVSFETLENYLDLSFDQLDDVRNINDYFIATQKKSQKLAPEKQTEQMQQAVYANLKLLKDTLTPEQYKKYLCVLNLTNFHRVLAEKESDLNNIYLAEK